MSNNCRPLWTIVGLYLAFGVVGALALPAAAAQAPPADAAPAQGLASSNAVLQPVGEFDDSRPQPPYQQIRLERSARIAMRDGVRLSTDLYFPVGAELPLPVILIRTPYSKDSKTLFDYTQPGSIASYFAGHGYIVAIQDTRGRHESEGEFVPSRAERNDGYDTIDWLARQPWSTGRIGTYGCSYLGESQIQLAAMRHPNHFAAIPQAAGGAYIGTDRPFAAIEGGVVELASGLGWFHEHGEKIFARPPSDLSDEQFNLLAPRFQTKLRREPLNFYKALRTLPITSILENYPLPTNYIDFLTSPPRGGFFETLGYVSDEDRFNVPAIHVNSWYDAAVNETLMLFNLFRANAESDRAANNQHVIVSPTGHCGTEYLKDTATMGEREMHNLSLPIYAIYIDWFARWLKQEEPKFNIPKVQYYLMGADRWKTATSWPPPNTDYTHLYLRADGGVKGDTGGLSWQRPAGDEAAADSFIYDPLDPTPSRGGPFCCINADNIEDDTVATGAFDQSDIEQRPDVLTYTSPVLEEDLEVTGPITAQLWVSTDQRDTDFTLKLIDVLPDGTAYNIQEAIQQVSYRNSVRRREFVKPGEVVKLNIDLHATANLFRRGHRIRIEISSSNFPRFARNTNVGDRQVEPGTTLVAHNTIYHSPDRASFITLPIVRSP